MCLVWLYLSAQVYTMNRSSYLSENNQHFTDTSITHKNMEYINRTSHQSSLNPFILLADDMILSTQKMETFQFDLVVTAFVLRPNGSPFVIPLHYSTLLAETFKCNENTSFFKHSYGDDFTIELRISLKNTEQRQDLDSKQQKQIMSSLHQIRRFLIFVGLIKDKSITSFRFYKNILHLKSNLVKALKNHNTLHNPNNEQPVAAIVNDSPIIVSQVKQAGDKISQQNGFPKKGGYFYVQKKMCQVVKCDGSSFKQAMAVKKIRKQRNLNGQSQIKLRSELELIKKIRNKKYLVNYYQAKDSNILAMDFFEKNLKDIEQGQLTIKQIFSICKQLVEAVSLLHESNIVHRDLKPQNILVETKESINIKIIDFGESAEIGTPYQRSHKLGCTLPYSPIECMINSEEGYNSSAIDLWSVVVIIHQLIFKQMPLFYNRKTQQELIKGWKSDQEFTTVLMHRPKRGLRKIEEFASLLTEQALKIEQNQRLKLQALLAYLKSLQIFYNVMVTQLKNEQ